MHVIGVGYYVRYFTPAYYLTFKNTWWNTNYCAHFNNGGRRSWGTYLVERAHVHFIYMAPIWVDRVILQLPPEGFFSNVHWQQMCQGVKGLGCIIRIMTDGSWKKNLASFPLEGQTETCSTLSLTVPQRKETQLQSTCWTTSFVHCLSFQISLDHIPLGISWVSFSHILVWVSSSNRPQSQQAAKWQNSNTNPGFPVNNAHTFYSSLVKMWWPCPGDAPTGTTINAATLESTVG